MALRGDSCRQHSQPRPASATKGALSLLRNLVASRQFSTAPPKSNARPTVNQSSRIATPYCSQRTCHHRHSCAAAARPGRNGNPTARPRGLPRIIHRARIPSMLRDASLPQSAELPVKLLEEPTTTRPRPSMPKPANMDSPLRSTRREPPAEETEDDAPTNLSLLDVAEAADKGHFSVGSPPIPVRALRLPLTPSSARSLKTWRAQTRPDWGLALPSSPTRESSCEVPSMTLCFSRMRSIPGAPQSRPTSPRITSSHRPLRSLLRRQPFTRSSPALREEVDKAERPLRRLRGNRSPACVRALSRLEKAGVRSDTGVLDKPLKASQHLEVNESAKQIFELAGENARNVRLHESGSASSASPNSACPLRARRGKAKSVSADSKTF